MAWNDENNTLAAMADGKLVIFYYPNVAYIDRSLLSKTIHEKNTAYVVRVYIMLING